MTAKKQTKVEPSDIFNKMLKNAQKKYGTKSCYVAPEHAKSHFGIPINNLALQYLLTSTVLPLERIIGLSGPKGSGKSALSYELLDMVIGAQGIGHLVETENKTNKILVESFLDKNMDLLRFDRCKQMEDAHKRLTGSLRDYTKMCPERNVAMCVVLDSLVGNRSAEFLKKMDQDGHGDRSFSKEALIIGQLFDALPDYLTDVPILFLYTNHEKQKIETGFGAGGGNKKRNPGGDAPAFHATYHIRVSKIAKLTSKTEPGNTVLLKTEKNSMGIDGRRIEVNYRWDVFEDEDGYSKQKSWFDWNKATCDLLAGDAIPRTVINEFLDVKKVTNAKYSCKQLKMSEVSPTDLATAIHSDPELMRKLQVALNIFKYDEFDGTQCQQ
jgi:RecA/RadA recombinase